MHKKNGRRPAYVTQVQQRFSELWLLLQGLLVVLRGILHFGALLRDEADVVEQLAAALTRIQELLYGRTPRRFSVLIRRAVRNPGRSAEWRDTAKLT